MVSIARRRARRAVALAVLTTIVAAGPVALHAAAAPVRSEVAPEYADGPRWQLAIVVDARNFISPSDYAAELEAIASGLDDRDAIPRDGRFAISVTALGYDPSFGPHSSSQWAHVVAWSTVIDSDAVADDLKAQIRGIPQAETYDNEMDYHGFSEGVQSYFPVFIEDGLRSVCQVSFSRPSYELPANLDGVVMPGMTNRVDLIGVGGYGNTGRSDQETEIGDHAVGGTGYTYVPDVDALADTWVTACTTRFPLIVGMEVTQSVQTLWESIPLVSGKATVVRVFAESIFKETSYDATHYYATLSASRTPGGTILGPEQFHPVRRDAQVRLTTDWAYKRDNPSGRDVLEFLLPAGWIWTGDLLLEVHASGGATCTWPAKEDAPYVYCGDFVEFDTVPVPKIWAYRVTYDDNTPTDDEIDEQMLRLKGQWPVEDVDYEIRDLKSNLETPSPNWVLTALWFERNVYGPATAETTSIYYGFVDDSRFRGKSAVGQFTGASSITSADGPGESIEGGTGIWRTTFIHESNHAIGLHHELALPITDLHPSGHPLWAVRWKDPCNAELGALEPSPLPAWGYYQRNLKDVDGELVEVSFPIGSWYDGDRSVDAYGDVQKNSPAAEVWGIDTRYVGTRSLLAYADPRITADIMSYVNGSRCGLVDEPDRPNRKQLERQGRWSTRDTYNTTMGILRSYVPLESTGLEWERKLILGEVSADGAVNFGPVLEVNRPDPDYSNDLGFALNLYDAADEFVGTAIPEVGLLANDMAIDGDESSGGGALFAAEIEYEGVARVELTLDGEVLGSTAASAHAPTVTVTSPASGAAIGGDTVTVEWVGEDADGDALEYDVVYTDDGANWVTLARGQAGQSLTFDRSEIWGSTSGAIRVIVNDGFHSAYDEVTGLAVAGLPPTLRITSPTRGATFEAEVPLVFDAYASDPEDGALPDSEVTWTSSVDGLLNTSGEDYLRGRDLTPGLHTLTAAVTDSDGNTTRATSTILILAPESGGSNPPAGGATGTAGGRTSPSSPTPGPSPSASPSPSATPTPSATPSATPSGVDPSAPSGVEPPADADGGPNWWLAMVWIAVAILGLGAVAWRLWVRGGHPRV